MFKMHPETSEAMKTNNFYSHLQNKTLQAFRNITVNNKRTLEHLLIIFWRKDVAAESQVTAKHKGYRAIFDPDTKSLSIFLEKPNECAEQVFRPLTQQMIDSLLYAKIPSHLKWSLNLAFLENGTYDRIVAHLDRKSKWLGWKQLENYLFSYSRNGNLNNDGK